MRGSEFAELQAFLAVAEQGSFVRAAEALQVSPSALSQTIKGLEARLDVRLFHRTTRRVGLSLAGEGLLARLKPAVEEVEAAVADTAELVERPQGRLRLHAFRVGYQLYLAPLLVRFAEAYPDIELDLTLDDQPVDMIEAGFDGAIRLGELLEQDMIAMPLGATLRHYVVASPAYVKRLGQAFGRDAPCRGRRSVAIRPWGWRLASVNSPPWKCTMARLAANPRPYPPV